MSESIAFLASRRVLWQTTRVKRRIVMLLLALAAVVAVLVAFTIGGAPATALPSPNGYGDFAAAAQWAVVWPGDLFALPPEQIEHLLQQNSKALECVRQGLKKPARVPVTNDLQWFSTHMIQLGPHRSMAQLLVAEGRMHLQAGRTNEAARAFADCILFAHAAHRGGLMLDDLVAIACQAMGARQLLTVAPSLSPDVRREILSDLVALDRERESAMDIVRRDRAWARGTYGLWRSLWMKVVEFRGERAAAAKLEKKHDVSVASLRLLMAELAVRGYEARNGKPPATLRELVPIWLPAAPIDPFSRRPLVYRVMTNSFLLYSVGPDRNDDDGAPLQPGTDKGDLLAPFF